jgi:hypothetical protein
MQKFARLHRLEATFNNAQARQPAPTPLLLLGDGNQ